MTLSRIREVKNANPFRRFNIVLAGGRRLLVDKPYYLGISTTKRFVVHSSLDGGYEVVAIERVQDVELDPPSSMTGQAPEQGAA